MNCSFEQLSNETLAKIKGFGIRSNQVFRMFSQTCQLLKAYLDENQLDFSIENGQKWLSEVRPCDPSTISQQVKYAARRRAVLLLSEHQEGKLDAWRIFKSKTPTRPKTEEYLQTLQSYTEKLQADGMAEATIKLSAIVVSSFLIYLENADKRKLSEMMPEDVTGYFAKDKLSGRKPDGVKAYAYKLRFFLVFLEELGAVSGRNLSLAVPKVFAAQESIVKVLSENAVKSIRNGNAKSDKRSAVRNHAMVLLGLCLGIRESDIVKMKLTDIDWKNNSISFTQQKTEIPIILPLLPNVRASLMEYILDSRPKVSTDKVFISHYAPYRALSPVAMNKIAGRYLSIFDLEDCPQYGAHILRRTVATRMLQNNIPRSVISASIGQIDPNSVDVYLSANEKSMRECAISLKGIECVREDLS